MCLDVDDTTGYGPETITLNTNVNTSPYYYYVYRYSEYGSLADSGAKVSLYKGDKLLETYSVPTDQDAGRYWNVFAIINGRIVVKQ